MSNFWDLLWLMFSAFMFVAYLFVMFQVVADLFRDSELGGFSKALWIIGLILLPFLTALVYVIARGSGMARRQQARRRRCRRRRARPSPISGRWPASRRRTRSPMPSGCSTPARSRPTSSTA